MLNKQLWVLILRTMIRRDRTQALRRWAAGSCRYRLLVGTCRCRLPMMTSHVTRWPASFGDHQVCSKARPACLHQHAPATVCRLVCVTRPPLPRAPWLRRHYPPSSLLRAHAQVLWPPCPFDLGLVGTGLCRLCHPRLVHRTVLALTLWLLPKVSC